MALALAVVAALIIPVGYFGLAHRGLSVQLDMEADAKAASLTALVSANPDLWKFQRQRIEELLSRVPEASAPSRTSVMDLAGNLVATAGGPASAPVLASQRKLHDSGRAVGEVKVESSLRPLLAATGGAALFGLLFGVAVFWTLRAWPLRALRRLQSELLEEKERYAALTRSANDAIILVDIEGRIVEWNERALELYGYDSAEMRTMDIASLRTAAPHLAAQEYFEKLRLAPGLVYRAEHRRKDGRLFPVEVSARLVRLRAGEYSLAVIRDLTDIERAANRYALAVEASIDGYAVFDPQRRFIEVNAALCGMTGYSRDELLGKSIEDVIPAEGRQDLERLWDRISAAGRSRFETQWARKDGAIIDVRVTVTRSQSGELLCFLHDITEHRRARKVLEESEARYRTLFEAHPTPMWLCDTESGAFLDVNEAAVRHYGYSREDFLGMSVYQLHPADEIPRLRASFRSMDHLNRRVGRTRHLKKNGESIHVEVVSHRLSFLGHSVRLVLANDISERLSSEATRHNLEAQLREAQKMEAIGTLAGGIAHDFNNILAAILGNASLAQNSLPRGHPALVSIQEINKAGGRAKALVQQILTFSRRQPQEFTKQPLRPLVEETLKLLRATLPAGVNIVPQLTDSPLYVSADANQLEQVLMNLCTNAWHAMDGTAGRIDIELDEVMLDRESAESLGTLAPGRYVRLSVEDNGHGMDEATRRRMFEPFFTTKPVDKGTGLGLAVVHGIVQAHHGTIDVRSALGEGTTVAVYLPAVLPPSAALAPAVSAPGAGVRGQGERIMYVDDDEAMVFLVTRMLKDSGFSVDGYQSAERALAAVQAKPHGFDLVVTDYNMPQLSGLDLARQLMSIRPDLPVVITTGDITEELSSGAEKAGVRRLVYKPDTVDELCEVIRSCLGRGAAR